MIGIIIFILLVIWAVVDFDSFGMAVLYLILFVCIAAIIGSFYA